MRTQVFLLAGFTLLTAAVVQGGVPVQNTEDFSTTAFRDSAETTALWDTVGGLARLNPFTPVDIGWETTAGQALNVTVDGQHAYLADNNGLKIVDVGDRTNPTLVGSVATPGTTRHVAVAGHHAYVADSDSGLTVVDVSDPTTPVVIGNVDTPGSARAVVVSGNTAYLADNTGGLQVADITDPTAPSLIGNLGLAGQALDVAVAGYRVYVAAGGAGMHVVDVSDPTSSFVMGTMPTTGLARGIAVSGDVVYVADSTAGLVIIDVSDPVSPAVDTIVPLSGSATDVAVEGHHAYTALGWDGVDVVDVSDYTGPAVIANLDNNPAEVLGVAVDGNHAFAAINAAGLWVMEVASPVEARILASPSSFSGRDVYVVEGDYLVSRDTGTSRTKVYDISDPETPRLLANMDLDATALAIDDNRLFVGLFEGILVVDLSDPGSPVYQGLMGSSIIFWELTVDGDYLYGAPLVGGGVYVFDVSDPNAPVEVASLLVSGGHGLEVRGNHLFAIGGGPMSVVDVSDPTSPVVVGTFTPPGSGPTSGLAVSGSYAYVMTYSPSRLYTVDVSDPANPTLASEVSASNYYNVAVHGDRLYATYDPVLESYQQGRIREYDISNPATPVKVDTYYLEYGYGIYDLVIHGDLAYAGWYRDADLSQGIYPLQRASRFFTRGNVIQSVPLVPTGEAPTQVKITSVEGGSVEWEVYDNSAFRWQAVGANLGASPWVEIPASDLAWRATLAEDKLGAPAVTPFIDSCTLEWRFPSAVLDSVVDVPGDQGGWARVHFTRSAYDDGTTSVFAEEYVLLRRTTTSAKAAARIANPAAHPDAEMLAADLPPGTWEIVTGFSPLRQEQYVALAPTLADSTVGGVVHSVYTLSTKVGTGAQAVFHVSVPDSGYSIDNIAPGVPQGLAAAYNTGSGNELTWDPAAEPDFQYHRVYRSTDPGFVQGPANLVHETVSAAWTDPVVAGFDFHYKVTTLDHAGNESDPASPGSISDVPAGAVPQRTQLLGAAPNPFNPFTKLSFALAVQGHARLVVFDTAGKRVSTLIDEHREAGHHHVTWDGRDQEGRPVASGVYFYRLEAQGHVETRRMLLVK